MFVRVPSSSELRDLFKIYLVVLNCNHLPGKNDFYLSIFIPKVLRICRDNTTPFLQLYIYT